MTDITFIELINNTSLNNCLKISNDYYLCEYDGYKYFIIMHDKEKAGGVLNCATDIHIIIKPKFRNKHLMSTFLQTKLIQKYWPNITKCTLVPEAFENRNDINKKIHLVNLAGFKINNIDQVMFYYNNIFIND